MTIRLRAKSFSGPSRAALLLAVVAVALSCTAWAGVAVIANHTSAIQTVQVTAESGISSAVAIQPGFSRPLFSASPLHASLTTTIGPQSKRLADGAAYRIVSSGLPGSVMLKQIGFGEQPDKPTPLWRGEPETVVGAARWSIPVVLYVDEEEPTRDAIWQRRLTARIEAASTILQQHAGVSLRVAGFGRWQSEDRTTDFLRSFDEFQRSVDPPEGHVAIGFTSQYVFEEGPRKLGGTRGSLRRHVMLREWSPQVTENERLQLLVHELGHHFGAAHSPETESVMRALLGDRRQRLKAVKIRFDVANTLILALVGDEIRSRGVTDANQLTPWTRHRLAAIYAILSATLPEDPAAGVQARRAGAVGVPVKPVIRTEPLAALTATAATNRKLPLSADPERGEAARLVGDDLTDALVRSAAKAAMEDPSIDSRRRFLVALGLGLDDSETLRKNPRTRAEALATESDAARSARINVLQQPTVRGRNDTLKHFAVSAALAAMTSSTEAHALGFAKEAIDAQGGSGFSFADLAADRAGIRFAEAVLAGTAPLAWLAEEFRGNNFVPALEGYSEGLPIEKMMKEYGGQGDPRFQAVIGEIDRGIEALPPYRPLSLKLDALHQAPASFRVD
ncbi:hypothetical protein [Botrimarina hoheduenensis]|uniref:Matrixin n=1 Tax=Botrimarina hoheduenensis TaxID=2528000 RepID=A0A5C5VRJ0_9BACT|nr:hypothetical protein [Botrimarina hoheduenensis]TWT40787.1 hypothetical protein Pla111_32050 [Botrimarina hoheduenensis]